MPTNFAPTPVACGNHTAHGPERSAHHHRSADEVRRCFAAKDGLTTLEQEAAFYASISERAHQRPSFQEPEVFEVEDRLMSAAGR